MPNVDFVIGGPVQSKSGTYLPRPADEELFSACQAAEICYVLACRQIGKTSLMNATADKLSEADVRTARIDLNRIGKIADADRWYFSLIAEVADRLKLEVDVDEWWDQTPDRLTATQRFGRFLHDVVLQEISEMVVIFIDEIDTTLGLGFTDDFFAAIRTIYNERAHKKDYHRLTFVLLGVATPDELIKDNTRTPFNVGRGITLRDFTREDCGPFQRELQAAYPDQGDHYFDQIYYWTKGHPYLTQKLCDAVLRADRDSQPDLVEQLVEQIFLAPDERSEDNNLQFVQDRIRNDEYAEILLRIYQRVLQGDEVPDEEQSKPIMRLKLYGLVVVENGRLVVRNNLYGRVFDEGWVKEMAKSIRLDLPDKYTLQRTLGQRGFVTVNLAHVHRDDGNEELVALKVLEMPPEADEHDWAQRMERLEHKAAVIAEARHSHTVPVMETGRIDDSMLYIEMAYIQGDNLRQRLKSGPLARNEALRVVKEIGSALTYLHGRGIHHLGVNPKDILFDRELVPPRAMLTDFGFARFQVDEPYSQIHRDYAMLTPYYVAPELKKQQAPTPSVDVYGLAITFFEMLTGYLPTDWQPEQPLPRLSAITPEVGELFDDALQKATAVEPGDRYESVADFIEALDAAQERELSKLVNIARDYITVGDYDPQIALSMLKKVFDIYPDHSEALRLRGKVRLREKRYSQALTDYQVAYEQAPEKDPFSVAGREYLMALSQVADDAWNRRAYDEAVQHYETIRHILAGKENGSIHNIVNQARNRLVEHYLREGRKAYNAGNGEDVQAAIDELDRLGATPQAQTLKDRLTAMHVKKHYELGLKAYAEGAPKDLAEAVRVLEREISALEGWQAHKQSQDLQDKLRALRVKQNQEIIQAQKAAIDNIDPQPDAAEVVFKHYVDIDTAYQILIELEPENQQWVDERYEILRSRAQQRLALARQAEDEPKPDYKAALRHYQAIRTIEDTVYPDLSKFLGLDLAEKLAELEEQADYDRKYFAVRQLTDEGKYAEALNQLVQDFINVGNYEHRDVAFLFGELVHAKQYTSLATHPHPDRPESLPLAEARQKNIEAFEAEIEAVQQELAAKRQELETVQAQKAEKEQAVATLRQEVDRLRGLETEVQAEREKSAQLAERLEKLEAELQTERDNLDQLAEKFTRGQTRTSELERENKRLAALLEAQKQAEEGEPHQANTSTNSFNEANKYAIPFALAAAVLAGGIIAPQLQSLSGLLSPLAIIAVIVLVLYLGYYLWIYYRPDNVS